MKKYLFCLTLLAGGAALAGSPASAAAAPAKPTAAKGAKPAAAPADPAQQRTAHAAADIDYWTSKYDGSDLRTGEYYCPSPRIPQVSKQNEEIDRVGEAVKAWQACYNHFVEHMNKSGPLDKRIPADIAALMTPEEKQRATAHLAQVRANVIEDARISSKMILADFAAWRDATNAWVKEHNEIVRDTPTPEQQRDIDARRRNER